MDLFTFRQRHGQLRSALRALYRLPHTVRSRGHIDTVDAEWTQRINYRVDDDRRSSDGTGFANALNAYWISLARHFFKRDLKIR